MTSKECLNKIKHLQSTIQALEREHIYWRNQAESISKNTLDPHYNPNRRSEALFADCLSKCDAIQREIAGKILELSALWDNMDTRIEQLQNPDEKLLLRYRYFNLCSWTEICRHMGISRRTAYRILGRALNNLPD